MRRILLATLLLSVSGVAFATNALQPGEFKITANEAEARAIYNASVAMCAQVAISVDGNGVWLVQCSGPDRNGGQDSLAND